MQGLHACCQPLGMLALALGLLIEPRIIDSHSRLLSYCTGKLLLFGAEPGLLDEHGKLVRELRPQQVPAHLQRLGSDYQGELLDAAAEACKGGVARSHIVSYAEDGALLTELFTRGGGGTLVSQEQF